MRNLHLCIAILPALVMALLGTGVVALVLVEGPTSSRVQPVLIMAAAAAVCVLIAAFLGADAATRRAHGMLRTAQWGARAGEDLARRLGDLMLMVTRGRHDLMELMKNLANGDLPPARRSGEGLPAVSSDPVIRLARELQQAQNDAWNAVLDATDAAAGRGPDQRVEVFVSLARRMQSLSHRAIQGLDDLENQVEDPDLLKGLFRVDHLSTRMRRQAESLAVIGGAVSRRQWSRPVTMYEVLRSAIAEVEQYNRVKVVPPVEGTLNGGAVADIIHLLAELIENATKFAPPQTQVLLRAESVTAGLAIEVEDRGLGIPRDTGRRLNDLLADFSRTGIDELLRDGRIGLVVVSALARRHNVAVQLQPNVYGGTQAVVVLPKELVGGEGPSANGHQPAAAHAAAAGSTAVPAGPAEPPAAPTTPAEAPTAPVAGAPAATAPAAPGVPAAPATPEVAPAREPVSEAAAGVSITYEPEPGESAGRPPLPRRRAQENLVPQLRDAPMPHLEDDEAEPFHDPGLMAAFQRGMRDGHEDATQDDHAYDERAGEVEEPEPEADEAAPPAAAGEPGRSDN